MNLISVIVPVYNAEKHLARCVDSILNQSYKELEVILVDDGSVDNSSKLCDAYMAKDKRVKVIHKENGGVSSARNTGINVSKGQFVTFVDSDDWIEKNMYESLIQKIKEENVDMVKCCYYKEENGIATKLGCAYSTSKKIDLTTKKKDFLYLYLNGTIHAGNCCLLVRKNVIDKTDKYNTNIAMGEDLFFEIDLICNANSIFTLNEAYYHYCINDDSASMNSKYIKRNIEHLTLLYFEIIKFLNGRNIQLTQTIIEEWSYYSFFKMYILFFSARTCRESLKLIKYIIKNDKIMEIYKNINTGKIKKSYKLFTMFVISKNKFGLYVYIVLFYTFKRVLNPHYKRRSN